MNVLAYATVQAILNKSLYPGMLILLVGASLGVPIPEDIPLILGGGLCRLQSGGDVGDILYPIIIGLIGVLSGDIVLFMGGRRMGLDVLRRRPFRYLVTADHIEQMQHQFRKRGNRIIFFGRFFAGVRAVMCVTSGICRVPAWKFILIDFSGALISVPFLVGIGWWFSNRIQQVLRGTVAIERVVETLVILVLGIWAAYICFAKRRRKHREQPGPQALPDPAAICEIDEGTSNARKEDLPV